MDVLDIHVSTKIFLSGFEHEREGLKSQAELLAKQFTSYDSLVFIRAVNQDIVKYMLEQQYSCDCATISARRSQDRVIIQLKFNNENPEHGSNYQAIGTLHDIEYLPNPDEFKGELILVHNKSGEVSLRLSQGKNYFFNFMFIPKENSLDEMQRNTQFIRFQIAIPYSTSAFQHIKDAMQHSTGKEITREIAIENVVDSYLQNENTLEKKRREGVEKIKRMGLSPDEEEKKLRKFESYIKGLSAQI